MEIKVNIPKNNYVQPTEIRQNVVQAIANILLRYMDKQLQFVVGDDNDGLYLTSDLNEITTDSEKPNTIRVNGLEVNAAFNALSEAGYYFYGEYNITRCTHYYHCSRKPKWHNREPMSGTLFNVFID